MTNDETTADHGLINEARQIYHQARAEYNRIIRLSPHKEPIAAAELEYAVLVYFQALRPHVQQDLAEYWHSKNINKDIQGLKSLDEWEWQQKTTKKTINHVEKGQIPVKQVHHEPLPTTATRRAGLLLDEAYKKLGFAADTRPKWGEVELTVDDIYGDGDDE